jgi:malonate transporter and related proteins
LLARGALPLGLLAVGAGLNFSIVKRSPLAVLFSNTLKLLAIPALTALFCHLQSVDPVTTGVAILFASLPTSASAYVMARQFGGDHELMSAILTTQVMMAAVTIPLMLALFG